MSHADSVCYACRSNGVSRGTSFCDAASSLRGINVKSLSLLSIHCLPSLTLFIELTFSPKGRVLSPLRCDADEGQRSSMTSNGALYVVMEKECTCALPMQQKLFFLSCLQQQM